MSYINGFFSFTIFESSKNKSDFYSSSGSDKSNIFRTRDRAGTANNILTAYKNSSDNLRQPYGKNEDEHHTRLGEHAAVLWKYNKITDITVKLRGVSYPAHKTVLSCYSKYFKEMLLESKGNITTINILTGKTRHDVHSVYTYVTAKKLGLVDAASRALRTMSKRFEQIVGTPEFLDLTFDQVTEYLSSDVLATRSEVIVFLAALKWISVRYMEREQFAVDVIGCVRFPMMTLNEVLACHSPPLLPGIMEIPQINQSLLKGTW
ncbi:BACK domain-containing protein [Nephila pilipes]|uniref:BACK domain-containing protein n=1 Tax=Nephila pilipes TaxID=299642 RepID=A0A8X6NAQ3_NEPPI|nr:BACK domain-containing protein [Nephila pilipes]